MKFNKFVAPVMAGALSLTLGLAACGGASSSSESASTATSEVASTTTSEVTSDAASATTEAATTAEDKIIYWEGESDKGDVLLYGEDEENNTSSIILYGDHDDKDELLAFDGPATLEDGKVTITDSSTGDVFSFDITGATEEALTIDLGEHGAGTLKPVTEKEFNEELDKIATAVREVGEALETLDDQDVEELVTILDFMLNESGTTSSAQSTV